MAVNGRGSFKSTLTKSLCCVVHFLAFRMRKENDLTWKDPWVGVKLRPPGPVSHVGSGRRDAIQVSLHTIPIRILQPQSLFLIEQPPGHFS